MLEGCGPDIVCIKKIDNTMANAISQSEFTPVFSSKWGESIIGWHSQMLVYTLEQDKHNTYSNQQDINSMNYVFGNQSTDKEIFPIMVEEM